MHILSRGLSIFVLIALMTVSFSAAPAASASPWQAKVDPWVLTTGAQGETEFLVYLTEQADLSGADNLATKLEKGAYVYQRLTEVAGRTQPAVMAALKNQGVTFKPYWIANLIWVRGSLETVQTLAQRNDVAHIYANPKVKANLPAPAPTGELPASPDAIEWNILKVNADDVWAAGYSGQGAVVGGQDTGYDWEHPALVNQYRGWDGATADHNYNWHDAIHSGGGVCGPDSSEPCDDHGHGTHTMGTMVGDDGGTNQIGMAPGARWIGCRNMDEGVGTPATYTECYEWFIAPTDLNDENPNPALAPDAINNSWGCPPSEGCTDPNVLLSVVNNVRAAGILTAHSAGNSGSNCYTVNEPAAIYEASFSVGATTSADNIASFSSRGPVSVDGSYRIKPNVSAPGSNVRSSLPGGTYGSLSGTSMAAPHVAGLVALLVSANPALAGQVDQLEDLIEGSSLDISPSVTPQTCEGIPHTQIPNNTFGYGRIDALAAYEGVSHTFELSKSASSADIFPGGTITYTLEITHVNPSEPTANVVLTDTLPIGTNFVSASGPYTLEGSTVRWEFTSMEANESQSMNLVVQTLPDMRDDIINADYGVKSDEVPTTIFGDPVSVNIVVLNQMLSKTAPATVAPGAILTYTLTVTNPYSNVDINNIILTDTLPANTTFITATQPYTISSGTVSWDFASLGAAQGQSVHLAVQTPDSGNVVNSSYSAVADETNRVFGTPVQTLLFSDYFTVIKTAPEVVQDGSVFTYTLTVQNNTSASVANHLVLTDTLPTNANFITATLPVTFDGEMVTWEKASLSPGQTWRVKLVVQAPLDYSGMIVNDDYGVKSDTIPTVLGEPVTTQVHSLDLAKSGPPGLLEVGDLITYTLTVTNQHPSSDIHNLVLEDTLPDHTAYVSSDGTYSTTTGVVTWTVPVLAPGESWTTHLTVEVLPGAYVMIQNMDYHVRSDETPDPLFGEAVITRLRTHLFMPIIFKEFGG